MLILFVLCQSVDLKGRGEGGEQSISSSARGRARRFGEGRLTSEIRGQDPEYTLDVQKSVSYCSLLFE
jgi:hypothetical protein